MEVQSTQSKWQIIMKFGGIYALAMVALNLLMYITGMQMKLSIVSSIVMVITIFACTYFGIIAVRDNLEGGFITYGKSLGTGMLIGIFGGIIVTVYTYLFMTFIDPDFIENIMTETKRKMLEDGKSEEVIEQSLSMMRKMQSPLIMTAFGLLGNIFYALIASLIVSIFTKKENPDSHYNSL